MNSLNQWPTIFLIGAALAVCCGCRPAGYKFVETDKIQTVQDLSTLMWVQADSSGPRFALADDLEDNPAAMTDAQAREFMDMGVRLQQSGKRMVHFTTGEKFTDWANELTAKAATLETAARAGDGATAVSSTLSIRQTCRDCHSEYR